MYNTIIPFIQEKLSFLPNDPIIYIIVAACTFLGTFWGKKGLSKKRLSFRSVSFPIIRESTNTISNVNVSYKDEPISNLTITNFIIWNSSDKPIRKDDIVPKSLLCFFANNSAVKILDISIIKTNNPSINAQIIQNENDINLTFDFLKKKNGVVVQIIHTGQDEDIKFTGELIDGNLKCENLSTIPLINFLTKTPSPKANKIMEIISLIFISIIFLFITIIISALIAFSAFSINTIFCIFTLIIIFYFYFLCYKMYFRVPRSLSSHLNLNNSNTTS
ncbi:MAG: hypothetical protein J1F31_06985 [Erysipelotrichales bacterium]|nr:hypothetical protein [Erysipelotrichales bacterium]